MKKVVPAMPPPNVTVTTPPDCVIKAPMLEHAAVNTELPGASRKGLLVSLVN